MTRTPAALALVVALSLAACGDDDPPAAEGGADVAAADAGAAADDTAVGSADRVADGSGDGPGSGGRAAAGRRGGSASDGPGGDGPASGPSTGGAAASGGNSGARTARSGSGDAEIDDPPPRPRPLAPPVTIPDDPPRFERPDHVRGIYLNAWTSGSSRRLENLIQLARRTELNTFVIDVKDATGHVSYSSAVPLARSSGATREIRIHDVSRLLRRLEEEGIWPIARIVVVKDPILAAAHPGYAIQDTAGGPWRDGNGVAWLNPFDPAVVQYHLDLAREAAQLGFPEIQWDYVRFPDAPSSEMARATYPYREGRPRPGAIRDFLARSDAMLDSLGVESTADVFGVTTSARDVGIGQIWERFIDVVDVALPMVYPSHYYRGSFGIERPNAHPYEIVREALIRGVRRNERVEGAGTIRPWLQDFSLGDPEYGGPEVRAQIEATYDVGIDEWILWSPSSRYTEEALEPVGGWEIEPLMRVAGALVPVSERFDAIRRAEEIAEARARADSIRRADSIARLVPPDTTRPRVVPRDSLRRFLDSIEGRNDRRQRRPRRGRDTLDVGGWR